MLHVTLPVESIAPIPCPVVQVPSTRAWSWLRLARTVPTAPGSIFLNVTALLLILLFVTALFFSWAGPTLLFGSCVAA